MTFGFECMAGVADDCEGFVPLEEETEPPRLLIASEFVEDGDRHRDAAAHLHVCEPCRPGTTADGGLDLAEVSEVLEAVRR